MVTAFLLVSFSSSPQSSTASQPDYLSIVVGSVVAIIAAIGGAYLTYWLTQRQEKRGMMYRVTSDTLIVGAQKDIEGKIKILFDKSTIHGVAQNPSQKQSVRRSIQNLMDVLTRNSNLREVKNLRLVVVEVQNIGRSEILPDDFKENLKISFTGNTEILDANIVDSGNLKPDLKFAEHNVSLDKFLLHKNEKLKLKILATGSGDKVVPSARIVGVNDIVDYGEVEKNRRKRNLWILTASSLFGIMLYVFSIAYFLNEIPFIPTSASPESFTNTLSIFTAILGIIMAASSGMFFLLIVQRRSRRQSL